MRVVVVGSGASGVHFAQTALARGHQVTLLDVGRERPATPAPEAAFDELKSELDDPVRYFLGADFEAAVLPGDGGEFYGLPASQRFVLDTTSQHASRESGFHSLTSHARGGLAEAWTGGVYPLNDGELADFPFRFADLAPHYEEVARRIGIAVVDDDLARFMPLPEARQQPLALDGASARLLAAYERRRAAFHATGCYAGRSRLAVSSAPTSDRGECTYLGRCLLGCPRDALYTPSLSLRHLLTEPDFRYVPGAFVSHCQWDRARRVTGVVVARPDGGEELVAADAVALAAGALSTARIVLDSVRRASGEILVLDGLMDNQQILVPFLHLGSLGRAPEMRSYQYHQVCLGLADDDPREYVHVQLTMLKTAIVHPIIQRLPGGLVDGTRIFRLLRGALGVANVNLSDSRRGDCQATIEPRAGAPSTLVLSYRPAPGDEERMARAERRVARALGRLGCLVPPGLSHRRPKGASVHYAGLIPMGGAAAPLTAGADGESRDVGGLYFADGVTFPFLPAKNLTLTLMANAVRVARAAL